VEGTSEEKRGVKRLKARIIACAGSRYLAGEHIGDVAQACERLSALGYALTICYWNGPPDQADEVVARYEETLAAVAGLDCYLSVKAPALDFSVPLFKRVANRGMRLHFDAMATDTIDRTFELIERLDGDRGCTLPGRWRRSDADADRAVEMGLAVRIVKGQFKGEDDRDPRLGFLSVVDHLAGRARHVAIASHDRKLAAEALRRLQTAGTPCELEQLYGIPLAPPPARVYVPYGHALLPYAMAQLKDNPKILWWLVRDAVRGRHPGV
jgi:proline dehydrogenase